MVVVVVVVVVYVAIICECYHYCHCYCHLNSCQHLCGCCYDWGHLVAFVALLSGRLNAEWALRKMARSIIHSPIHSFIHSFIHYKWWTDQSVISTEQFVEFLDLAPGTNSILKQRIPRMNDQMKAWLNEWMNDWMNEWVVFMNELIIRDCVGGPCRRLMACLNYTLLRSWKDCWFQLMFIN